MRIQSLTIDGLNEVFRHTINFNLEDRLTIVHSPNGFGKTTILRLLHSLFRKSFFEIRDINFRTFRVDFTDGRALIVEKRPNNTGSYRTKFVLRQNDLTLASREIEMEPSPKRTGLRIRTRLPTYRQIDEDFWEDTRDAELVTHAEVLRRAGLDRDLDEAVSIEWLDEVVSQLDVRFIETQRLTVRNVPRARGVTLQAKHANGQNPNAAVDYSSKLAREIRGVLAEYAEVSQRLDQSFPTRLLTESKSSGPRADLDRVMGDLEDRRRRLREVGLLEREDEQFTLPLNLDGALQNVLSIYLGDVERKLGVFTTILAKLELFKQLINEHFSFKKMVINKESGFLFETTGYESLDASSLSSGEQHILVLVYDLLFTSKKDSLILIDEPEISLHVAWQMTFLEDIKRIADLSSSDFLIATHSPQIINDRWDLTVELKAPNEATSVPTNKVEYGEIASEQTRRSLHSPS